MTRSSAMLSLFAEPSVSPRRPSTFVLSIVAHAAVAGVVYFGMTHLPRIEDPSLLRRFSVRQLDLHLDPNFPNRPQQAAQEYSKIPYPGKDAIEQIAVADAMRGFLGETAGRQTLIQPQIQTHLSFAEQVPLPTMMIWTPELAPHTRIVPPLPNSPAAANVTPSLELPNQEIRLMDLAAAATDLAPRKEAIPAGTTSPIQTRTIMALQMAPATISPSVEMPTPTAVLSISDVRMLDGSIFLPPVNDVPKSVGSARSTLSGSVADERGPSLTAADLREEADNISVDGRRLSSEHIVLPHDGKFNVVVVGSSIQDEYPETPNIWANRMAYTAYLHVGLRKNWIMQYSMTRAADTANGGRVARLDAPWPYEIMRPNLLARDMNADALIVHGILNQAGRLESLAVAFPESFRYASFVLHALRQWQFRPAQQNGQATPVEVLLIIPEELD